MGKFFHFININEADKTELYIDFFLFDFIFVGFAEKLNKMFLMQK